MGLKPRKETFWMWLADVFKQNVLWLLELLFSKKLLTPDQISLEHVKRILVVRQHDQLGDFLLSTPVLRALRENYPQAKIGLVVREYFSEVARMNPFADEVLVYYGNKSQWTWARLQQFIAQLRGRWDLCVVLNTVSHSLTSDFIAYYSRAPIILGSSAFIFHGCQRNFFYNLSAPVTEKSNHQTEKNLDIVRYIGVDTNNLSEALRVPDEARQHAKNTFLRLGVRFQSPVIGIHLGAGKPENRWPVRLFSELAKLLHTKHSVNVVVFWGPEEGSLSEEFSSYINFPVVKIPPTSLSELSASFTQCDVLVCNDTGIMHVAASADVPLVAMFGATDPTYWKPIGEKFDYVYEPKGVEHISVASVIEKVNSALKNKTPQNNG